MAGSGRRKGVVRVGGGEREKRVVGLWRVGEGSWGSEGTTGVVAGDGRPRPVVWVGVGWWGREAAVAHRAEVGWSRGIRGWLDKSGLSFSTFHFPFSFFKFSYVLFCVGRGVT